MSDRRRRRRGPDFGIPVDEDLVFAWDGRFYENSNGNTRYLLDESPYGNHADVYGAGLVQRDGRVVGDFDGTDDYGEAEDDDSLDVGTDDFSVLWWMRPESLSWCSLWNKANRDYANVSTGWALGLRDISNGVVAFGWPGDYGSLYPYLSTGRWDHVTVIVDRSEQTVRYLQNAGRAKDYTISISLDPSTSLSSNRSLRFGAPKNYSGLLTGMTLVRRKVTKDESNAHYLATYPPNANPKT